MAAEPPNLRRNTHHSYYFLPLLLFTLLAATPAQTQPLQTETIRLGPFNDTDRQSLSVVGGADIANGALQITPDSINTMYPYLQNRTGRILLSRPFRLWDISGNATRVASFNTTFVVNIYRDNKTDVGEGLAFLISPTKESQPLGSDQGYLGLTNQTTDGNASNHFVAVELDTHKQSYDPDNNHVGININSVRSVATASLNSSGIVLSPFKPANYTVWIEYNSPSRHMAVYIVKEGSPKPRLPLLEKGDLDLSKYVLQDSYFGFSASTGQAYQLNCVLSWNLTVEIIPVPVKDDDTLKLTLAIVLPVFLFLSVIFVAALVRFHRRKKRENKERIRLGEKLKSLPGMPREFEYEELRKATGNFSEDSKLGQGGFGVVYKGKMEGEIGEVAVKMFGKESRTDDFFEELQIIHRLRHRNLVRLVGWCFHSRKLLIVYEFMPNGSLDRHLYNPKADSPLSWARRLSILTGVASALNYLHNEFEQRVVHRDLKPSNILLDSEFTARLGDFGLARAIDRDRTSYADLGMAGTMGYLAPEYFHTAKATRESDVYGFGTVVLEVVCCRRPFEQGRQQDLVGWVWMLYREERLLEAVDERLQGAYDAEEAKRLLVVGLACSHSVARERPKIQAILQMISGNLPLPHVPEQRPAFPMDMGIGSGMSTAVNSSMGGVSWSTVGTSTLNGEGSSIPSLPRDVEEV